MSLFSKYCTFLDQLYGTISDGTKIVHLDKARLLYSVTYGKCQTDFYLTRKGNYVKINRSLERARCKEYTICQISKEEMKEQYDDACRHPFMYTFVADNLEDPPVMEEI